MSTAKSPKKKPVVKLPFPILSAKDAKAADEEVESLRPKPEQYADRTWMPPRGTRRSFGKR
ncbi:hypothetical protein [Acinetobacter shaoyimingii]|uniref:Uncharacterized protein n=1 Tax=Acinetobacter shaoyimingii TaxID=2715164 RepID=A0A6G8RUN2_9GAMM|nr:hypothetical protein [Acinetobacter shaoyimingii]NHB58180.1 hypothetical protein [Acinetobacter shaoyimingii]QIO05587.1 hypothetical protein G8E00_06290 [Acinetobacter shaoyimingii]